MRDHVILRVVSRFMIPFIFLFAFYIQFHGKISPGGGFQAGVILASGFIVYSLIYGTEKVIKIVSVTYLKFLSALGVLIYAGVGLVSLLFNKEFLNYYALAIEPKTAQLIGISAVEIGVGITVFAVMMLIFLTFARAKE